jgi:AcrR family transcriptional regulator
MPARKSPVKFANGKTGNTEEKPLRRARRSTETVRRLILQAARELFSERGYAGATTREIAQRADINEVLLFRHFTSKAQLFERAVFEPCQSFIEDFSRNYSPLPLQASTEAARAREFVAGLYQVLHKNRRLMMALIAASFHEPDITRSMSHIEAVRDYYKSAENYMRREGGQSALGIGTSVRLSFGLIAAAVLFEDWMFVGLRKAPSTDRMIDDLSAFVLHGFPGGPTAPIAKVKTKTKAKTTAATDAARPRRKSAAKPASRD